jgi:hypothetical protein
VELNSSAASLPGRRARKRRARGRGSEDPAQIELLPPPARPHHVASSTLLLFHLRCRRTLTVVPTRPAPAPPSRPTPACSRSSKPPHTRPDPAPARSSRAVAPAKEKVEGAWQPAGRRRGIRELAEGARRGREERE